MDKNQKVLVASAAALLAVSAIAYKMYNSKKKSASSLPEGYGLHTTDDLIGNTDDFTCTTGRVQIKDDLYVTYWRYEDPKHPETKKNHPVIAMHGGPSFTHNYMIPLKLLARKGYPVIFYDQAGCGASFKPKDNSKYPQLFTIKYYVEEAHALVKGLNLENYYVYGSSWGSILAQEFALTKPKGLKAQILDGALCDAQLYGKTQWSEVVSEIPLLTQKYICYTPTLVLRGQYDTMSRTCQ